MSFYEVIRILQFRPSMNVLQSMIEDSNQFAL